MTWYEEAIVKGHSIFSTSRKLKVEHIVGVSTIPCHHCKTVNEVIIIKINESRVQYCPHCHNNYEVKFEERNQ